MCDYYCVSILNGLFQVSGRQGKSNILEKNGSKGMIKLSNRFAILDLEASPTVEDVDMQRFKVGHRSLFQSIDQSRSSKEIKLGNLESEGSETTGFNNMEGNNEEEVPFQLVQPRKFYKKRSEKITRPKETETHWINLTEKSLKKFETKNRFSV